MVQIFYFFSGTGMKYLRFELLSFWVDNSKCMWGVVSSFLVGFLGFEIYFFVSFGLPINSIRVQQVRT